MRSAAGKWGIGVCLGLLWAFTFGCATTNDIRMVQDDLFRIEEKINKMRKDMERVERGLGKPVKVLEEKPPFDFAKEFDLTKRNQAEIMVKIDELRDSLQLARGEVERQQYRMSELSQKLDALGARLVSFDAKLSALKPPKPPEGEKGAPSPEASPAPPPPPPIVATIDPNKVYQVAYQDYQKGNYPLAILGLKDFLGKYPQSARAEDAQYLLGECYYSMKEHENAVTELDKLIRLYPQSPFVPGAYLKSGYALWELNRMPEATARLNDLIKSYPDSEEAKQARERLKARPKGKGPAPKPGMKKG
ncbi:MAG: tol-pal system protein YbgF [Nitrospinae bacterium]|nr:tol-pal system protein YbgF [Nitrospinota bacterium]